MGLQLEGKSIKQQNIDKKACLCPHCIAIEKQQTESEQLWIKQHRLFDR